MVEGKNNIIEELSKECADKFIIENRNAFDKLINIIDPLVTQLNEFNKEYRDILKDQINNNRNKYMRQNKNGQSTFSLTAAAADSLNMFYINQKEILNAQNKYLMLTRNGMLAIEKIRETLTSEKTNITIGIEYYGRLYEATLSLEEALEYSKLGISSKGDIVLKSGLKEHGKGTFIKNTNAQQLNSNQSDKLNSLLSQADKKLSQGYIFEEYKKGKESINEILMSKRDTVNGFLGGDRYYFNSKRKTISEQLKFWGSSSFTFTSLTNIRTTLNSYLQAFKAFKFGFLDKQDLADRLKQLMIRKNVDDNFEKSADAAAKKAAEKYIDDLFK